MVVDHTLHLLIPSLLIFYDIDSFMRAVRNRRVYRKINDISENFRWKVHCKCC